MNEPCNDCRQCLHGIHNANGWPVLVTRMVLCPECGNKRCPKATDHRNACSGSNEPGQPGSAYQ